MQKLIDKVQDFQFRLHVSKLVEAATAATLLKPDYAKFKSVSDLVIEHPQAVLVAIRSRLNDRNPTISYLTVLLLEHCMSVANSDFHDEVALDAAIHDRLVDIAVCRAMTPAGKLCRTAGRQLVMDLARTFKGLEERYPAVCRLPTRCDKALNRSLERAILLESKHITFNIPIKSPEPEIDDGTWICPGCSLANGAALSQCAMCWETRPHTQPHNESFGMASVSSSEHSADNLFAVVNNTVRACKAKNATPPASPQVVPPKSAGTPEKRSPASAPTKADDPPVLGLNDALPAKEASAEEMASVPSSPCAASPPAASEGGGVTDEDEAKAPVEAQ